MVKRISPYGGILHEIVEDRGTLYLAGIVADDTTLDMQAQARDVLAQLKALLDANGSDLTHLLQVTIYIVDMKEKPEFNVAWKDFVDAGHAPARAVIGVADLGPGVRLELVATAAKK